MKCCPISLMRKVLLSKLFNLFSYFYISKKNMIYKFLYFMY